MGTTVQNVFPREASYPASNYPAFGSVVGTNFPVDFLAFDDTTEETCYFIFDAAKYGSGNITVGLQWYAASATSGDIVFGASLAAITPNTDTGSIEAKAFATEVTGTQTQGGNSKQLQQLNITVNQLDSVADGDWCVLRIARKAAAGGDTMTGDARLVGVAISYSDT